MGLRKLVVLSVGVGLSGTALGGGELVPGQGPISTGRAGAAVASAEGGEAIAINPAGMASTTGTIVQIGIVTLDYAMSFARAGTYDPIAQESVPYAGQPYPTITNHPKPRFGIGSHQPVPTIAVVSDLGGAIPGLRAGFGISSPQIYPYRDMNTVNGKPYFVADGNGGYAFPSFGDPPPPTRYDVIYQDAEILLPSLAVSYRALPNLDLGLRLSSGVASIKAAAALWGVPNNEEWDKQDGVFTLDAKDYFAFTYGFGAMYRPTPEIELGVNFNAPLSVHAQGDALAAIGPEVKVLGMNVEISPIDDDQAKCAKGGTADKLKGCLDFIVPMSIQVGGRYKFRDRAGKFKGDIELNFDWQHWGAGCKYGPIQAIAGSNDPYCPTPGNYRLVVDGRAGIAGMPGFAIPFSEVILPHGLRDTYAARLGGSYIVPVAGDDVIVRGGVGYDTAAAKPGWERLDFDGAARTTLAAGATYKLATWSFDAGFGLILEGSRSFDRGCNPTQSDVGCSGTGSDAPIDQRQGPDPINPVLSPSQQVESPVNQGRIRSHYLMWMVGASHRF